VVLPGGQLQGERTQGNLRKVMVALLVETDFVKADEQSLHNQKHVDGTHAFFLASFSIFKWISNTRPINCI
jgi:hypothetical protein